MYRIVKAFRVYDDANADCRIYRPGMTVTGADAEFGVSIQCVEKDGDAKADRPASSKALKNAPENK